MVEFDALSPEDMLKPNGSPNRRRRGFGNGEVRLVYKEAGSFEDESSPPEIDIIPSVKQQRQQSDKESLLYRTRLWAKTALEDTLESYAAFREEEAAREEAARIRGRIEYGSVGSDEMQFSFGSEEELDDLTFTEGDASFEYENYYYPDKYMPTFAGQGYVGEGRLGLGQDPLMSPTEEQSDEYVNPMEELKSLVHSVSEYLAVKEEEINNYESMPKPIRRKLPALPTDAKAAQPEDSNIAEVKPELKEDKTVEQGITGVKNAMSSLFSSITGSKAATEAEAPGTSPSPQPPPAESGISKLFSFIPKSSPEAKDTSGTASAEPPAFQASPQPESGISKLLSFIPKSGGASPPVAIVPPASQEPPTEKRFSLQSLLPFQSSEPSRQADTSQAPPQAGAGAEGSATNVNQPTSGLESMFGRLSPMRLFSSAPPSREPSPQPAEQGRASASPVEAQEASASTPASSNRGGSQTERQASRETRSGPGSGSIDLLPDTGSGSVELLPEMGSGSVELLPETESSGELPDIQQRRTSALPEPKPESGSEETGFFSPFKKSLSTLISTVPPENSPQTEAKSADESFLGNKLKIPFFSAENVSNTSTSKTEGGVLSGILKFASGDNVPPKDPSPSPARTPSPSRAALLESVPKGNTETGWFSNLFKVTPSEPAKEPAKPPITPTVILTKPNDQTEPQTEQLTSETMESTACKTELSTEQTDSEKDPHVQMDVQYELRVTSKDQGLSEPVDKPKTQTQESKTEGLFSGLLKLGSGDDSVPPDKKAQEGAGQPQQSGLFSGLFSSVTPQTQQNSSTQQGGGLLSGLLKLGSDNPPASTNSSTLPGGQSAASQTSPGGLFSGLLKKATDTVTGSQPTLSSQESQPDGGDHSVKTKEPAENLTQGDEKGSALLSLTDQQQPDQQLKQLMASDKEQIQPEPTAEKSNTKETNAPQPSGLFGGLLKLTETVSHAPKGPPTTQPTQQNQQSGNMLSGFLNKIVEPVPSPLQPDSRAQDKTQKPAQQTAPQQGGFLSGLFGIGGPDPASTNPAQANPNQQNSGPTGQRPSQQTDKRQNLQRQNQVPPQQPPSSPGGVLTGLFNKIADAGTSQSTTESKPELQQAQKSGTKTSQQPLNQQGGFLSGLFSGGSSPVAQQQPPASQPNQQQAQQANRQPLRRQNQIPVQPGAPTPEPQQGGLLSGLFNLQTSPQQGNKSDSVGQQSSQPSQQGGFLSGLFGQASSPQSQPPPGKTAGPQPKASQQPSQSGGLLSGILKLGSGENASQEQQSTQPAKASQPSAKSVQNTAQGESGGLLSGLMSKISGSVEQSSATSDQVDHHPGQQHQPHVGQGRPQIQRTKPVEIPASQDSATDKDARGSAQKGFLSGLFNVSEEQSSKAKQPSTPQLGKEEPKISTSSASPGLLSSIFKSGTSDSSTTASGKESDKGLLDRLLTKSKEELSTSTGTLTTSVATAPSVIDSHREPLQTQVLQDPTVSPTHRYLEEIQRLLYGTAQEYGYKDLLYNFTEHGVIPPELYEHQCLIEALLWQQLNDYALAEALASQVQEQSKAWQGHRPPSVNVPQIESHQWLHPMEMDISNFNVPSHPWKDAATNLFESRNRFLEPDEDLVLFDMSCRDKKPWSSCDHLNNLDLQIKPWIAGGSPLNLSMEKPKTRLSRSQSLRECSAQEFNEVVEKGHGAGDVKNKDICLKSATEFLKRLSTKMGPVDLTRGAVDLSKFAGANGEVDEMFFEDSEWYQQWLSLLEQGLWWPAEVGDCGYYVYSDEEYIYSLLTDRAGRYLYSCAAPEEVQTLGNITENIANILKQKERDRVTLCGFKIPLYTEAKDFYIPGKQQNKLDLSEAPMNLTSALRKGEKIMNMNLESFSQMFQESISYGADQPVDFTVYKLKKIKVESVKSSTCQVEPMEASDLTLKALKEGHGGPYWKKQEARGTVASTTLSRSSPTQVSPIRRQPIPEIRIAHVDDAPLDKKGQKSNPRGSGFGGMAPNTDASNLKTMLSSTPATSPLVSNQVSETSKNSRNLPETPTPSKIPQLVQQGRKLPTPPTDNKVSSAPLTQKTRTLPTASSTSVTTPVSTQRPQLVRQPSQAQKPRVQPNKTTVTETSDMNKINTTSEVESNQPQDSTQKRTPQLHILNASSSAYNEAHLYKQKCNFGTPLESQIGSKVLDFSTTINKEKHIKQKDVADSNEKVTKKEEIVDFTKYELKRFKEKKEKDANINENLTAKTIAVDLTQLNKEEKVQWPDTELPTVDKLQLSPRHTVLMTVSQNNGTTLHRHSKSERQLPTPEVKVGDSSSKTHVQKPSASHSTFTAMTSKTNVTVSGKGATDTTITASLMSSNELQRASKTTTRSTLMTNASGKASSTDGSLNQPEIGSKPSVSTPLVSPVHGTQFRLQEEQLHSLSAGHQKMQSKLPTVPTSYGLQTSRYKTQQHQETTAPANSIQATLDMSAKATVQRIPQTDVPSKDPLFEALSLKKKQPPTYEEADTSSCHLESIDLSCKGKSLEPQEETFHCNDLKHVDKYSHSAKFSVTRTEISSGSKRPLTLRQQSLLGQSSETLESFNSQEKATAPANTVKATLDMTSKSHDKQEADSTINTDVTPIEAIPLMRGKPSARELARKDSVGLPLVVEMPSQEPLENVSINLPATVLLAEDNSKQQFYFDSTAQTQTSISTKPVTATVLDMSTKPKQPQPETSMPEHESTEGEAISFVNKPSARVAARRDSVGIPLVVEPVSPKPACRKQLPNLMPVQKQQSFDKNVVYQPSHCVPQSITQPVLTAPANSVKGTVDMSTKVCKSDAVLNYMDPVPLVRTRPSSFAYSQMDPAGVPLIVETNSFKEQPKRQQTLAGLEEQVKYESMHSGSGEINLNESAPLQFLDMSLKLHRKQSDASSNVQNSTMEQCAHQQGRQPLRGVNTTETLHRQISTHHSNEVFCLSRTNYKDAYQHNKPLDFSPKDSLNTTSIFGSHNESEDGQPMNFTNDKAKKEMSEKRQTGRQLVKKSPLGIVDLSLDSENKPTTIYPQDATDLSNPNVSVSWSSPYDQQPYISQFAFKEVREDDTCFQMQRPIEHKKYFVDERRMNEQTSPQPVVHFRLHSATGFNSVPGSTSDYSQVPVQRKIEPSHTLVPQAIHDSNSTSYPLQSANQQINNVYAESKMADQFSNNFTQLQTQHPVTQQPYQLPGHVDTGLTSFMATSQSRAPKLQRQDRNVHPSTGITPKILIKQPTVESCGSIEEGPCSGREIMTSNEQTLPAYSAQPLCATSQTVSTPQSSNTQPMPVPIIPQPYHGQKTAPLPQTYATAEHYAKEPIQISKQPDARPSPVIVQQYHTSTVQKAPVATVQGVSGVSGLKSQPDQITLNRDFGAEVHGREVSPTSAGSTRVKGLISLFSGSGSQPSVCTKPPPVKPHNSHSVSTIVDPKTQVTASRHAAVTADTPTQSITSPVRCEAKNTISQATPVKTGNEIEFSPQIYNMSTSVARTPAIVSDQADATFKFQDTDCDVSNRARLHHQSSSKTETKHSSESVPLTSANELTTSVQSECKDQATVKLTELAKVETQHTESEYKGKGLILDGASPQASPTILPAVPSTTESQEQGVNVSQDHQQLQVTSPAGPTRETQELPASESLTAMPPVTTALRGISDKGIAVDASETPSDITSEVCVQEQQSSEQTNQTTIAKSDNTTTEICDVSVANTTKTDINPPKSIYIGINSSEGPPGETDSDEQKPYVRLPHIFVTAASSPEEEMTESGQTELTKISASEDTVTEEALSDPKDSIPFDIVAKPDILEDKGATEYSSTEAQIKPEQVKIDSPETSHTQTTADHNDADKNDSKCVPEISPTLTQSKAEGEIMEACEQRLEISSEVTESKVPEITAVEEETLSDLACQDKNLISTPSPPDNAETIKELAHEDSTSDGVASEYQSHDKLSLKEPSVSDAGLPEEIQQVHDKTIEKPPEEEIKTSKEESLAVKVSQPETEPPEERPGKGLFSMFSDSSPQQSSSQAGKSILGGILPGTSSKESPGSGMSILGGILPGSSTKDTPGTSLLSMFGGSNAQSSTITKDPPPPSAPQETPAKGLFSLLGGSGSQPTPGPRGPTGAHVRPKGPPPKETPGKGLFSMFGASTPQQQPSPRGHPGGGPTPKGPSSGSSIFGGILQGSTTPNETPGGGLFSKLGNLNAQPQTGPRTGPTVSPTRGGPEPTGKGLFSMFGQNQQAPDTHLPPSKPPESDSGFSVSSVFSLGGSSDANISKSAFGLFGLHFKEETKTEPHKKVSMKEEIAPEQVKPSETNDFPKETKEFPVEATENLPPEPLGPSSEKLEPQVEQSSQHGQDSDMHISANESDSSIPQNDAHVKEKNEEAIKSDVTCDENNSVVVQTTDTENVSMKVIETDTLDKKDTTVSREEQPAIKQECDELKDSVDAEKEDVKLDRDTFEIKSADDETDGDAVKSLSEKTDDKEISESVTNIDKIQSSDRTDVDQVKPDAEGETTVVEEAKQSEDTMNIAKEEQTAVTCVEISNDQVASGVLGDKEATVVDGEKSKNAASTDSPIAVEEKPSAEPVIGTGDAAAAAAEPVQSIEKELGDTTNETTKEATAANVELEEAKEPAHGLTEPSSDISVTKASEEDKPHGNDAAEITTSPAVYPPNSFSSQPASAPPPPQPSTPGVPRAPGPPGPRGETQRMGGPQMGAPRMAGPRMAGPRMAGPRMAGAGQPRPQKPPEPAPFSGFMSMFSSPNVTSKSSSVGGFFSSSPGSLFGSSSPTPRQPHQQQQQQQQKTSFFGLPGNIATESITSDLLGIFKGPEATKSEENVQTSTDSEKDKAPKSVSVPDGVEKSDTEKTQLSDEHVKSSEDSEVLEKGLMEEAERADKTDVDENSMTEPAVKTALPEAEAGGDSNAENLEKECSLPDKGLSHPPETKNIFEIPSLSAPKFGFMSEGTSSIGSLFSGTPPSATGVKTPQTQQTDGGFFSGFKNLSASILQDDKPAGKDEPSTASSVFNMKLGSIFGNNEPPKAEATPHIVTTQPQPQNEKPSDERCEPESEKHSPRSSVTGSPDASDTEGPTETSKTGSCDTLAQSPQVSLPSHSVSRAASLDKPQVKITPSEIYRSGEETPDTVQADPETEQPKDLLKMEAAKRLVQFVWGMVSLILHASVDK